jgi:molecular chaperone DnaJ
LTLNTTRDGDDLYYNLDVSFPQASLGDEIKVPTLNGNVMFPKYDIQVAMWSAVFSWCSFASKSNLLVIIYTFRYSDLYYNLDVSFPQASLGDEIKVPTLNGNVMLTIPP